MAKSHGETIRGLVEREAGRIRKIPEQEAARKPSSDAWSKKEIVGHLVDSASNNHQRFVRAMLFGDLSFPAYAQNDWVRSQGYADESWDLLVDLWSALNLHLAHLIGAIPVERFSAPCRIGEKPPIPLDALIADYIRHLEHHLGQL